MQTGRIFSRTLAQRGWRVGFQSDGLRLSRGDRVIRAKLGHVYVLLRDFERIERRLIYSAHGHGQLADIRGNARYWLPERRGQMWQNEIAEEADTVKGYMARGTPTVGQVVFDVGAYCGEFTVEAARLVGPTGRVIAFEPHAPNRELLLRNVREAGLGNVVVAPHGLWATTGDVVFETANHRSSSVRLEDSRDQRAGKRIPVLSLRDAADRFGAPDFVKMDIEGAEIEVLAGAAEWLKTQQAHFAIASYHLRAGRPTAETLERLWRQTPGYRVETGHPEHLTTWAWRE